MKITKRQIRKIIKEVEGDSSELLQVIAFKIITNTGPGTDFDMEDILIDIRGLNGVITVSQNSETESLGYNTGMERRFITAKFDNSPYVDIPTLKVDMELVPGVQEVEVLTVDGDIFSKEQAQKDYNTARSPEAKEWWNNRNKETKIPEYEGSEMRESKMKITKRQLRKIIKEEKRSLLTEAAYIHDIFRKAAERLEMRDGDGLERLSQEVEGLLMPDRERNSYVLALNAMTEAAYELQSYEEGEEY